MRNREIPDNIINRAVDLWCKELIRPAFDNGDDSEHGGMSAALAAMNIESAKSKVADIDSSIEVFRKSLTKKLFSFRDGDEYFSTYLDVDYAPCETLADAAKEAGIPCELFSIKSSVIMNEDRVSASFGYGAENINHYPVDGDRWLLTTLIGSDISKVIDHVISGNEMGMTVESSS